MDVLDIHFLFLIINIYYILNMKHFLVNQSNIISEILNNASVVKKIYDLVTLHKKTFDVLDNNSNFIGKIYTSPTYQEYINDINDRDFFPDLNIIPSDIYIKFEDPIIEQILIDYGIGDGIGITKTQAAECTQLPSFENNTEITSFNELQYFTKIKSITLNQFKGCTNLENIDLRNITTLYTSCFENSGIKHANISNVSTYIQLHNGEYKPGGSSMFKNCTNLETVILKEYQGLANYMFYGCTKLYDIGIPWENIGYLSSYAFTHCSSLTGDIILNFNDTTNISGTLCDTGFTSIKIKSSTITQFGYSPGNIEYNTMFIDIKNCKILDVIECNQVTSTGTIAGLNMLNEDCWLLLPTSITTIYSIMTLTKVYNIVYPSKILPDILNNSAYWYEWNDSPSCLYWVPDDVYDDWLNSTKLNGSANHLRKISDLPIYIKEKYLACNIDLDNL